MKKPFQTMLVLLSILSLLVTSSILYFRNNEARMIALNPIQSSLRADPALIDLNTATLEQLCTLPGIGPKLAQSILSYRDIHGGFRDFSELLNVDGIGKGRLEDILPFITIGAFL